MSSLFQRRHFRKIAEMAHKADVSEWQLEQIIRMLHGTNIHFNESRFRVYFISLSDE